ncbi:MAG TPA: T9SS type A sorting domain-containing protein [Bacteroidia bacterium]|nr:T9SS type A sorting domain-containing protein [Bacteroidia bacterium]
MKVFRICIAAAVLFFSRPAFCQDTIVITESNQADWAAGTMDSLVTWSDTLMLDTVRTFRFAFTNCGQTGNAGPLQASVNSAYAGTDLDGAVISDSGIQQWVTPEGGVYRILAAGAGHNADTLYIRGAILRADFEIAKATGLNILVGQMGDSPRGGNGGTFVTYADTTPLIIAGGAAGMRSYVDAANRGSTSTSGQSVSGPGCSATGGVAGMGGEALGGGVCSGAGGGLLGDGQGCGGGKALINGGTGGAAAYTGGFGGGGGVDSGSSPGGGGGYSGGSVHYTGGTSSCAGGGGSYLAANGTNVATSDGYYDNSPVFNGDSIASFNNWHIGHGMVDASATQYVSTGVRTSPVYDISTPSSIHNSSTIVWQADTFAGTTFTVETRYSLNAGSLWSVWDTVSNGSPVAGLLPGLLMDSARFQARMTFATTSLFASPQLYSITVAIINDSTSTGVINYPHGLNEVKIYPNPVKDNVTISYFLLHQSAVSLRLHSASGYVMTLHPETLQQPGQHVSDFSMNDLKLAAGVYWIEVIAGGETARERLVLF